MSYNNYNNQRINNINNSNKTKKNIKTNKRKLNFRGKVVVGASIAAIALLLTKGGIFNKDQMIEYNGQVLPFTQLYESNKNEFDSEIYKYYKANINKDILQKTVENNTLTFDENVVFDDYTLHKAMQNIDDPELFNKWIETSASIAVLNSNKDSKSPKREKALEFLNDNAKFFIDDAEKTIIDKITFVDPELKTKYPNMQVASHYLAGSNYSEVSHAIYSDNEILFGGDWLEQLFGSRDVLKFDSPTRKKLEKTMQLRGETLYSTQINSFTKEDTANRINNLMIAQEEFEKDVLELKNDKFHTLNNKELEERNMTRPKTRFSEYTIEEKEKLFEDLKELEKIEEERKKLQSEKDSYDIER